MLRRTFRLLSGIGKKTEAKLWTQGIDSWTRLREADPTHLPGRVQRRFDAHARQLERAEEHLANRHPGPFNRWLPAGEHWRVLKELGDETLYLDIETTGLSYPQGRTTVVGGYLPRAGTRLLVRGDDLNQATVQSLLDEAAVIVTFNGKRFDLPFLRQEFGVTTDAVHVDLMHTFRSLGITGGLKTIESRLGLARDEAIDGMSGYEAVKLWRAHRRGDPDALETLLAYNRADVENMVPLARTAYERKREDVFQPYQPDPEPVGGQAAVQTRLTNEG